MSEALRLAEVLDSVVGGALCNRAAAELRRQHAENKALRVGRDEWENEALRMRPHQQRLLNRAEKAEAECDALRADLTASLAREQDVLKRFAAYQRNAIEEKNLRVAECDALRAALKFIADHDLSGTDLTVAGHIAHALIGKARAALKEAK